MIYLIKLILNPLTFQLHQSKHAPLTMAGATIGSAAINGFGSLVGGLFQNNANKRLMREQMHWSESMYDKQVQDQYDLIDYVNKYNTPANQRQLLEAAGYNPALLGQAVSSASSSSDHSIPSVPSAPAAAGYNDVISPAVASATNAFVALTQQQINQENADTNRFNAKNTQMYYNKLFEQIDVGNELTRSQRYLTNAKIQEQATKNIFMSDYMDTQITQLKASTLYTSVQTEGLALTNSYIPQEKAKQLAEMAAQIDLLKQKAKTEAYTRKEIDAQIKMLSNQAYLLGQQADRVKQLAPYETMAAQSHATNLQNGVADDWKTKQDLAPISTNNGAGFSVMGNGFNIQHAQTLPSYLFNKTGVQIVTQSYAHGVNGARPGTKEYSDQKSSEVLDQYRQTPQAISKFWYPY